MSINILLLQCEAFWIFTLEMLSPRGLNEDYPSISLIYIYSVYMALIKVLMVLVEFAYVGIIQCC